MIIYTNSIENTKVSDLAGFFVGWPNPPKCQKLLQILQNSQHIVLAKENEKVVGFIAAISDKTLVAYISLLEVLPNYQKQGIGQKLMEKMLEQLKDYYMVDLVCDENLVGFYEKVGMQKTTAMKIRNYPKQSGK